MSIPMSFSPPTTAAARPAPLSPNPPRQGRATLNPPGQRPARDSDPTQLQLHRAHCAAARSQLHGLRGAVEMIDAFLSPRFFSTLAVLSAAGLALAWWLA